MPSVKFKMIGGLAGAIGRSGPEYVQDSVNWFAHAGTLKKRKGMTPFRAVNAQETTSGVYVGWGKGQTALTTSTVAGLPLAGAATDSDVYIGADAPFNRFMMTGKPVRDSNTAYDLTRLTQNPLTDGCAFYYGTAGGWVQFYPGNAQTKAHDITTDTTCIAPFTLYSGSNTGTA